MAAKRDAAPKALEIDGRLVKPINGYRIAQSCAAGDFFGGAAFSLERDALVE